MPTPNPEFIAELKRIVNTSPYPSHMSMRLAAIDIDKADIELDIGACPMQPFGIVHGGVLATLIDTATFWSVLLFLRILEAGKIRSPAFVENHDIPGAGPWRWAISSKPMFR